MKISRTMLRSQINYIYKVIDCQKPSPDYFKVWMMLRQIKNKLTI